jgi:hypothetical protein
MSLVLQEDVYSLGFFGFYLDSDLEELSWDKGMKDVKDDLSKFNVNQD